MTETDQIEPDRVEPETYEAMFTEYVQSLGTIDPKDRPLIFHARKLCQQLDTMIHNKGATEAAKDSAYLQAVERLDKRLKAVPGPPDPEGGRGVAGQQDLFEFHEDGQD